MKVLCLLALTLMGLSLTRAQAVPNRCCFDREFTAVLGEQGGIVHDHHAVNLEGILQLSYDFYNHRQGTVSYLRQEDGSFSNTTTLQDYGSKMTYTITRGRCSASHMGAHEEMFPPCIPADARYLGPARFGYGPETLDTHNWEFRLPGTDLLVKMSVTETCVPVFEAMYGHINGDSAQITFFLTAYHPGIPANVNMVPPSAASCPVGGSPPVGR